MSYSFLPWLQPLRRLPAVGALACVLILPTPALSQRHALSPELGTRATPASPEQPEVSQRAERSGTWWSAGLGAGVDWIVCDICEVRPRPGVAAQGAVGTSINHRLLLGLELDVWTRGEESARHFVAALAATGRWYPRVTGSLFLKAGFAAVGFRADGEGDALTALDPGGLLGLGWDRRIGDDLWLVPFAQLLVAPRTDLTFGGSTAAGGAVLTLVQAGLAVTWR